jgi:hypothetical protein
MRNPWARLYWVVKLAALAGLGAVVLEEDRVGGGLSLVIWLACWLILIAIWVLETVGNKQKITEVRKLDWHWKKTAALSEGVFWVSSRLFTIGVITVLVGGDLVSALVWGGLLGILLSLSTGVVVLVANRSVGFYADPESEPVAERKAGTSEEGILGYAVPYTGRDAGIWGVRGTGSGRFE